MVIQRGQPIVCLFCQYNAVKPGLSEGMYHCRGCNKSFAKQKIMEHFAAKHPEVVEELLAIRDRMEQSIKETGESEKE